MAWRGWQPVCPIPGRGIVLEQNVYAAVRVAYKARTTIAQSVSVKRIGVKIKSPFRRPLINADRPEAIYRRAT
jgi:hypothetical protein